MQLIECVPNFSEGVNTEIIEQIADVIRLVNDVKLLNVDPGRDTNRTVITFAGKPEGVIEAAFFAIKKAGELIDMSTHKGEHPRMGTTDVCPLIPLSGISMEETAAYARKLAQRVGEELRIPVYLYGHAQPNEQRNNLSIIRAGEYEGFFKKIKLPGWQPDYGPAKLDVKRGATVIGARDFLIAYNINLDTDSVTLANEIAADVRESGRVLREGDNATGKIIRNENGKPKSVPGLLRSVKAIGWYIKEYGKAQVSMNLTNIKITPLHKAFEIVSDVAARYGVKVTGSELIGLIPLKCMTDAGAYFLQKQSLPTTVLEKALVDAAITYMGMAELTPFDPEKRIIEYLLRN